MNADTASDLRNDVKCGSCPSTKIEYKNFPCGCIRYCKKCAMKMATGGKCKVCHELFSSMKSL